ncbi:hypothetical protein F3Y22_tig00111769pilonHSYRG00572 [Hibiscus syriacus]|uniref:GB1/RHD3-type G domain-containing protein n=1 Tax=Hibiscus syriacus TaxID=106335 RepID=A0A6A2YDZ5_HIBSY|nr:hypothetical protein F3Y22_tig00111769pilonHSYRG00572 [Hibiscus syriacus]
MPELDNCCSTQLIDGDGEFNVAGLDNIMRTTNFSNCGLSFVAIVGPQSSGKSTLLNYLFHTNFREMDAYRGRSQTTKGIWITHCVGIEPFTIAMDLEGTDGRERGEVCHDIGREQAANKPLLKTVFQEAKESDDNRPPLPWAIAELAIESLPRPLAIAAMIILEFNEF